MHGNTTKDIAKALYFSVKTIDNYIQIILKKLEAKNRTHAVVIGYQNGWVYPLSELQIDERKI